ncbi:MAG: membrane protein insertase YidC [Chloroherpetonaceae bacterium]|nr:membrane protein insertase YidC [Chloroherpetonaceae bacterium]MDW8438368.1 membrane protein insertase YidC [Chloroherpetonaceae bacterium]
MDRNALIGLLLIGLIFIVWMQLLAPSKPKPKPKPKLDDTTTAVVDADSLKRAQELEKARALGAFSAAAQGEEKLITVETDLFTAVLSSKGATLKSFVQKKYLNEERKPFDLVTASNGAIALFFQTRDGKNITTTDLYFAPKFNGDKLTLSGKQSEKVPFELALPDGKKIEIVYRFVGDSYRFDLQTNLVGLGEIVNNAEYQVVWNGGLAHSERSRLDEAMRSYAHAMQADELLKLDADKAGETKKSNPDGKTKWVSVQSKYFIAAIIAENESKGAYLEGYRNSDDEKLAFENYVVALREDLPFKQREVKGNFSLYVGPLDYDLLKDNGVGLERALDFGWEWLTRPFAEWLIVPVFNFLNQYITNYGIIIIIFAFLIKLVTYPLTAASTNSMKKLSMLQPQIQAVQEKYKNDPAKLQDELAKIYKEAGVNPLSGCLPILLQMPLLIAMYNVFSASIQLRQESFLWADDLSAPDAVVRLPFSIPLYGDHIALYPILMAISIYVQQKITPQQSTAAAEQMKVMNVIFPIMMLLLFNNLPAGLGLYYFMFNVFGLIQQIYANSTLPKAQTKPAPAVSAPAPKKKKEKVA